MSRLPRAALIAAAALCAPGHVPAQPAPAPRPTVESTNRLVDLSNRYVRLVLGSLNWKAPATQACAIVRMRIESASTMIQPLPSGPAATTGPPPLEGLQRIEENTMGRHAMLTRAVYEAVAQDCLQLP